MHACMCVYIYIYVRVYVLQSGPLQSIAPRGPVYIPPTLESLQASRVAVLASSARTSDGGGSSRESQTFKKGTLGVLRLQCLLFSLNPRLVQHAHMAQSTQAEHCCIKQAIVSNSGCSFKNTVKKPWLGLI